MQIELKCKTCGAKIFVDSLESNATCEFCSMTYTLPADEKREKFIHLYSKADDAWDYKDFDEAERIYQMILDEDNQQFEAHWAIALCKYGISYEIDPASGKKMPTCNRINKVSILEDQHYKQACKYAPAATKSMYQKRAQEIDDISKEFLKIVENEKPYDVFISYKRTDDAGDITHDSQLARKLYYYLNDKGYKVFFAEITLKNIAGEKYEPYIFSALTTSPVMIVVGSKPEYFNATWVRNEWKRYLGLMNLGEKKTLIPAYSNMNPYNMPGELRMLQAMNAEDLTFNEDVAAIVKTKVNDARNTKEEPEQKQGTNLADKYAPKEKVARIVDEYDCDKDFAISALVLFHGDEREAGRYISEDRDYQKKLWVCAECGKRNTRKFCHNQECGISKEDSIELEKKRREILINTSEEKARKRRKVKKTIGVFVILGVIAAILVGIYFLMKAMAFADTGKVMGGIAIASFVIAIILLVLKKVFSGEGGVGFTIGMFFAALFSLIVIYTVSSKLFIKEVQDLYTPQIIQAYSGTVDNSSYNKEDISDYIITIDSCDEDGNVTGTREFIKNGSVYGKYKITGKITSKKNNGIIIIEFTASEWVVHPEGYNMTDSFTVEITDNYTKMTGEQIKTLTVGVNDKYAIKTVDDLQKLVNSSGMYQLNNDLDLSEISWTPIEGFKGTLIGNGYTIKNLKIESDSSQVGFFSTLEGTVTNLKFENASVIVTGYQEAVGILCGELTGMMSDITVSGTVIAVNSNHVGGVAGSVAKLGNYAMSNIINNADINGAEYVGGIAGYFGGQYNTYGSYKMQLNMFKNSGNIQGNGSYVGGIFGYLYCENTYSSSSNQVVQIYDFENTGDVLGKIYVGGIFGNAYSDDSTSSAERMKNCANIQAEAIVGCIGGWVSGIILNSCSNEGSTLTASKYISEDGQKLAYVGGLVGCGALINNSKNSVSINYTAGGRYVGGISGYLKVTGNINLENLENAASINGAEYVGGIAGYFGGQYNTYGSYKMQLNMFKNSGNIQGNGSYVGGIFGYLYCENTYSSSSNQVVQIYDFENTRTVSGKSYTGGLFGYAYTDSTESVMLGCVTTTGKIAGYIKNLTEQ